MKLIRYMAIRENYRCDTYRGAYPIALIYAISCLIARLHLIPISALIFLLPFLQSHSAVVNFDTD